MNSTKIIIINEFNKFIMSEENLIAINNKE